METTRHDYSDDECAKILERLAPRLRENSKARLLVNEIVVPLLPTVLSSETRPLSESTPQAQSSFVEMTSMMQLHSLAFQGGYERTYQEYKSIFERAGYHVVRFHQIQTFTAIMEVALTSG